jgi:hypothetical protein
LEWTLIQQVACHGYNSAKADSDKKQVSFTHNLPDMLKTKHKTSTQNGYRMNGLAEVTDEKLGTYRLSVF